MTTLTSSGASTRAASSLAHLELVVRRRLDGLLQGEHLGLVPGGGSEPGDGRAYQPGDDVRRMDWNLTARSAAPHVRERIADRELELWLVVDGSASVDYGTAGCEKRDLALAAAATFGFLTARSGNRVGAVLFGPGGIEVVPPRSGRDPVAAVLRRVERRPRAAEGPADLAAALRRTGLVARRRGLVVVVGDLIGGGDWPRHLRALGTRHDLVVAEVADPRDADLPPVGLLTLVDPETGRLLDVQTSNPKLRARFAEAARVQREQRRRAIRAAGAAHLELSTDRDWLVDVVRFVARRRRGR